MLTPDRKQWIDIRRNIVKDYYDPPTAEQAEADALFAQMEALALQCADQGEFETRLAASPLTQQYNDLLARLAPYVRKDPEYEAQLKREKAAGDRQNVIDNVKRQTRSTVLHELNNRVPIKDYKWGQPWYYAIPVVGPIIKHIIGAIDQARSIQTYAQNIQDKRKKDHEQANN